MKVSALDIESQPLGFGGISPIKPTLTLQVEFFSIGVHEVRIYRVSHQIWTFVGLTEICDVLRGQ